MGPFQRNFLLVIFGSFHVLAKSPLPERSSISLEPAQESGNARAVDESYFLPKNSVPFHYFIQLTTNVQNNDLTFQATTEIHFEVVEPTRTITMHLQELDIQSTELSRIPNDLGNPVVIDKPQYSVDTRIEHVTFTSQGVLPIGKYLLKVSYTGTMRNYQSGYLVSSYRDAENTVHYVGSTHFQATLARRVFPCYDEPALKATIELWITHHQSYNAVANMPINSANADPGKPGYLITKFRTAPKMSTYLLAFAVTDFPMRANGRQQVLARMNAITDVDLALEAGTKILDALDKHTGVAYYDYMPKLTQIAVPDRGTGAMENWGLVTYGEPSLLFDPAVNSYRNRKRVTSVIAHEYAHQWFGNLVSPQWWDYIWLSEGFATLYEYYATTLAYPELQYWELFSVEVLQRAFVQDATETTRPMNHPAASQDEVWKLFDIIAYQKSGSVLNMFRQVLGDDNWKAGLNIYLNNRKLNSATPDDLFTGLQTAIEGKNVIPESVTVKQLMETWTNAAGYPVLNVRRVYQTGDVIVSQDRFLADKRLPSDHLWSIPYNYAVPSGPRVDEQTQFQWLTKKAAKLTTGTASDQWIIFNREQMGYYRVNYDQRNWELIIDALLINPSAIHPANRAQLIDDSFNLARADQLDMSVALKLLSYLRYEIEYAPWAAANNVLNYFYGKLRGTPHYSGFVNFVHEITTDVYNTLQIVDVAEQESTLHKYLKQTVSGWACRMGHTDCLDKTYAALKQESEDGVTVHPDVAAVVYCHGLRDGSYRELSYLLPKMVESKNQAQRTELISALGCTKDAESVKGLLTAIQLPTVTYLSTEKAQIVEAIIAGGREGIDATVQYLMTADNAKRLWSVLGEGTFNGMVLNIASHTNNASEQRLLDQLLVALKQVITVETAVAARTKAQTKADWFNSLEGLVSVEFYDKFANTVSG